MTAVDRLNIVAHDKFQEIVDEANKPDSPIRCRQSCSIRSSSSRRRSRSFRSRNWRRKLGFKPEQLDQQHEIAGSNEPPAFYDARKNRKSRRSPTR